MLENSSSHSAADLLAQGVTRVTGVEAIQTKQGLELILETVAGSERLVPLILPEGNDLVIEILDATLAFPIRNGVTQTNPAPGISRITVNESDENSIQVRIAGENQTPSAEVVTGRDDLVLSVTPDGTTAETEPDDSINVIATGEGTEDDYFVPEASTATLTDTPIRDIPQSIQVIPQQVIEDQQAIELEEVLNNVSGVTTGGTNGGADESFNVRGFSDTSVLRDGFRQFGERGQNFSETANLERVEVLKGPASILYGEIEPGGIINLVTKKPLEEPLYKTTLQLGDDALVSPSIDFSDSLTSDGRLRYRLNALYRHENSFRDFDEDSERFFVAPVISWQIGDRTDLTVQLDYTNDDSFSDLGLPASGESIDVPFDTLINEPDSTSGGELVNVGYNLEHRFSDNWRLRNAFRFSDRELFFNGTIPIDFDDDTGTVTSFLATQDTDTQNYTLQTNVVGEFDTGSVEHTLVFGVDLNRTDDAELLGDNLDDATETFNIFDPVFGAFDDIDPDDLSVTVNTDIQSDRLGIFLQDQIDILDNLILLAGVRYDTIEQTTVNGLTIFDTESSETTENFDDVNPRVGLVYQPIPEISLFGSYSQSFSPNSATTSSGDLLVPEESEGFEFGVKGEVLEGKLLATLGYFNITN